MSNCTVPPLLFQEAVRTKPLPKLQRELNAAITNVMQAAAMFTEGPRTCEQYSEAIASINAAATLMKGSK